MQNITLDYILNHTFEKTGLELLYSERKRTSRRFAQNMLSMLPHSDEQKMQDLKVELDRILYSKNLSNAAF